MIKTLELFAGASMVSKIFEKAYTENLQFAVLQEMIKSLEIIKEVTSFGMAYQAGKNAMLNQSMALSEFSQNITKLYIPKLDIDLDLVHIHDEDVSEEEQAEEAEVSEKIISEILLPESKKIITPDSPIITVAPINDEVLRYLKENPEEWFKLTGGQFEMVMQEIYSRLGYHVERTKATRDGGKDLIIHKNGPLGDFIYYVECKKHAPNRPVSLGIVQRFKCVVDTDNVNGGIVATTSFFTKDAKKFILANKYDCQVKLHDGTAIKNFLNQVC
jgi:restriction endonuclease Mrr